ncbi:NAD-dependent epimerase/dehydratase family protein [Candidatus Peregrinibacteria bacterium]|nr:NAD-dependent epimerase/dehydratase family protein [Candidatus Peregrinibacteria bacterium]
MAKYLVTGGAGFIGTNLVKELLKQGHQIVVLDNYAGGKKEERFLNGAEYIEGDIRNEADLDKACQGVQGIFHLAAMPRVTFSVDHPEEAHDVNVNGTLKLLLAARKYKIKRLVFSSSSSVYGNQPVMPLVETMVPAPISPYGLHKLIGEHYCRLFVDLFGVETVSLRYVNVYGPYFDPDGPYALVVGKFIKQAKNGEPMTVCGDGEYQRDFVHVSDVAQANLLAMENDGVGKGEVINISSNTAFSVNQVCELIGEKFVFVPERPGDVRMTKENNAKAKQLLNWEPKITFEEGIKELKKEWGLK